MRPDVCLAEPFLKDPEYNNEENRSIFVDPTDTGTAEEPPTASDNLEIKELEELLIHPLEHNLELDSYSSPADPRREPHSLKDECEENYP